MDDLSSGDRMKRAAAARALDFVEPGMRLGLGTGSTAAWLVRLLEDRAKAAGGAAALDLFCVPTSSRTRAQAEAAGLTVGALDDVERLDLAIDGADEADGDLSLIKGGGGALFQEKIVAAAADRFVVIADPSKRVDALGAFPLPIEVTPFGAGSTRRHVVAALEGADVAAKGIAPRMAGDAPFVTDEGNLILDLALGRIGDPAALHAALIAVPGVVETGLFVGMADALVVGREDGSAELHERPSAGGRT
ncbi:MAG: ribose-5-phosphate isomerase RpiA [Pseudomonadota bacterium]